MSDSEFGYMTRKTFLRSLAALGAGVALGQVGLIPGATAQEEPQRGGILNYNVAGAPPNFDPVSNTSTVVMSVIGPCYNGLVRADPDDPEAIVPDLATSWDVSEDGTEYTFHLVDNAKFHDGTGMTSADVKFTFDYIREPPEGVSSPRKSLLSMVDSIEAIDPLTVRFKLSRPSPAFITSLSSCWMLVLPKHIVEVDGHMKDRIVGTGPFRLKENVQGVSIELERNPDYHVPNRPFLDGAKAYVVPDAGTTLAYLKTGQLDWFVSMRGQEAGTTQSDDKIVVLDGQSTTFLHVMFNLNKAPFDDIRVRKAASIALDRRVAIDIISNGFGTLGGATLPGKWAASDDELAAVEGYGPVTEAKIGEAKKLLAEAGHENGLQVKLLVRKNPLFEPFGVFVKDQWAKIGIDAQIDIQETAAFNQSLTQGQFDASPNGNAPATTDPDSIYGVYYTCDAPLNNNGLCDTKIDELNQQQTVELDPDQRAALVRQLEIAVLENYSVYNVFWTRRFTGMSRRVHGLILHPNIDQNMRLESVWLAS